MEQKWQELLEIALHMMQRKYQSSNAQNYFPQLYVNQSIVM